MTVPLSSAEVDVRISSLLSEMGLLEREVRHLHDEVTNLERAEITACNGTYEEEEEEKEEQDNIVEESDMTEKERIIKRKNARALTTHYMPEEFIEELYRKRDKIHTAKKEYVKYLEEKDKLMQVLERNHQREDTRQKYLSEIYNYCGWEPGEKPKFTSYVQPMDECVRLRRKLQDIQRSTDAVDNQLHHATSILQDLGEKNDALNNVNKELFDAQTELRLKEFEYRGVCEEISYYKRIFQKKIKMLDGMNNNNARTREIKHLEAEKRVKSLKLLEHKTNVSQTEVSVRLKALQIRELEHKINKIGEAIRADQPSSYVSSDPTTGDTESHTNGMSSTSAVVCIFPDGVTTNVQTGPPNGEDLAVDSVDVKEIQNENEALRNELVELDRNSLILDAEIEVLQRKMDVYDTTKEKARYKLDITEKEHMKFNAMMDAEIEAHEDTIQYNINRVTSEINNLEERLRRMKRTEGLVADNSSDAISVPKAAARDLRNASVKQEEEQTESRDLTLVDRDNLTEVDEDEITTEYEDPLIANGSQLKNHEMNSRSDEDSHFDDHGVDRGISDYDESTTPEDKSLSIDAHANDDDEDEKNYDDETLDDIHNGSEEEHATTEGDDQYSDRNSEKNNGEASDYLEIDDNN
eukprot:Tbor_TRINITY_DN5317_c3_g5::TRINITY_DN5317_c3_g5_i1::g.4581::m.4581